MSTVSKPYVENLPEQQMGLKKDLLNTISNTYVPFKEEDVEKTISDRFEQQVRLYPDNLAIESEISAVTYNALNKTANRVARTILGHRGEGEEVIALLLDNDEQIITAMFAILKAGKTYVVLDPSHPQRHHALVLNDSQACLVLTNDEMIRQVEEIVQDSDQLINVDQISANVSDENLDLSISPDTFAAIYYTSGSTGQPKGIVQNHRNILHRIWTYTNSHQICADDRLSHILSCGFSASIADIFGALLNGATLCPFTLKKKDLNQLIKWLTEEEITIFHPAVALYRQAVGLLTEDNEFPKLRLVALMSESIYKKDLELFKRHFSHGCVLGHWMGSGEAGLITRLWLDHNSEIDHRIIPVGFATEGKEILILDDSGNKVGYDSEGEIVIKSRYLSPGYWQRPDLTEKVFRPDPAGSNEWLYLTGDLGRLQSDGCLEYLGRKDFQVKIKGHKVEIPQIETLLYDFDDVKEAIVGPKQDEIGNNHLVAYVVPYTKSGLSVNELRSRMAETLSDYMIPTSFVFLEQLPLTPNGKVDRNALPEAVPTRSNLDRDFVAPQNPVEEVVARIWFEAIGLDEVGMNDNFFELGGDSLLAMQVITQVNEKFKVDIPLSILYDETPTVAELAKYIKRTQEANSV